MKTIVEGPAEGPAELRLAFGRLELAVTQTPDTEHHAYFGVPAVVVRWSTAGRTNCERAGNAEVSG